MVGVQMSVEEMHHIADLLKADVVARQVFFGATEPEDESCEQSKAILIKFTLAAMGIYDTKTETDKPFHFSGNPRLN